jgi:hypothetical protein
MATTRIATKEMNKVETCFRPYKIRARFQGCCKLRIRWLKEEESFNRQLGERISSRMTMKSTRKERLGT